MNHWFRRCGSNHPHQVSTWSSDTDTKPKLAALPGNGSIHSWSRDAESRTGPQEQSSQDSIHDVRSHLSHLLGVNSDTIARVASHCCKTADRFKLGYFRILIKDARRSVSRDDCEDNVVLADGPNAPAQLHCISHEMSFLDTPELPFANGNGTNPYGVRNARSFTNFRSCSRTSSTQERIESANETIRHQAQAIP